MKLRAVSSSGVIGLILLLSGSILAGCSEIQGRSPLDRNGPLDGIGRPEDGGLLLLDPHITSLLGCVSFFDRLLEVYYDDRTALVATTSGNHSKVSEYHYLANLDIWMCAHTDIVDSYPDWTWQADEEGNVDPYYGTLLKHKLQPVLIDFFSSNTNNIPEDFDRIEYSENCVVIGNCSTQNTFFFTNGAWTLSSE